MVAEGFDFANANDERNEPQRANGQNETALRRGNGRNENPHRTVTIERNERNERRSRSNSRRNSVEYVGTRRQRRTLNSVFRNLRQPELRRIENQRLRQERQERMRREEIARRRDYERERHERFNPRYIDWPQKGKAKWKTDLTYVMNKTSFREWLISVRTYLEASGLWIVVGKEVNYDDLHPQDQKEYIARDKMAVQMLTHTVDNSTLQMIRRKCTDGRLYSYKFVEILKSVSHDNKLQNIGLLRRKMLSLKYKEGESMLEHISKINECVDEIGEFTNPPTEAEKICTLLESLPESWHIQKTMWYSRNDMTWSLLQTLASSEAQTRSVKASATEKEKDETNSNESSEQSVAMYGGIPPRGRRFNRARNFQRNNFRGNQGQQNNQQHQRNANQRPQGQGYNPQHQHVFPQQFGNQMAPRGSNPPRFQGNRQQQPMQWQQGYPQAHAAQGYPQAFVAQGQYPMATQWPNEPMQPGTQSQAYL